MAVICARRNFTLDSETPLFLLRSKKPKHEAHDDRSQFELSTCSSSGKKKLSLNWAISNLKNASLTSQDIGHWTTFLHRESFILPDHVCGFCAGTRSFGILGPRSGFDLI